MKIKHLLTTIFLSAFVFLRLNAGTPDTLKLSEYLKLFDNVFTSEFNLGWTFHGSEKMIRLSFDKYRSLQGLSIELDNGRIMTPEIYGWAYSYRKINNNVFWLVYYTEGESGTSFWLQKLDIENVTLSKAYQLANAFGDQGDWAYKVGNFVNDSTYNYLLVYGTETMTLDSISGEDRIKSNGECLELKKRKLIK